MARDSLIAPTEHSLFNERPVQLAAREKSISTLLSGFGGDQIVSHGGPAYLRGLIRSGRWGRVIRIAEARDLPWVRFLLSQILETIEESLPSKGLPWRYMQNRRLGLSRSKSLLRAARRADFLDAGSRGFDSGQRTALLAKRPYLNPEFARSCELPPPNPRPRDLSVRSAQIEYYHHGFLSNRIESWADAGAEFGISYRYPLLDRRVMEFALGVPEDEYANTEYDRLLFRRATASILPESVIWRKNQSEPARTATLEAAIREALAEIGSDLRTRRTQPRRAGYLDMPRLLADLEPESLRERIKFGKIVQALQFLDFE